MTTSTRDTKDPVRAGFEEWYATEAKTINRDMDNVFSTNPNGSYVWVDTRVAFKAWQAATKHQSDKCAGLVGALEKCEKRFLEYAASHRLKGTADGIEKAGRNHDMAVMCKKALKEHRD